MISFLSLFLGLIVGDQPVELQVADPVARVEVLLDGELVGDLGAPPWSLDVSFGEELLPHRLEALAYDAAGTEIGRAVQWINLSRPPAEAFVTVDPDPDGRATSVSVSWESVRQLEPSAFRVEMDGAPLEIEDPRSFVLPPHDPQRLHFLRVELDFGEELSASAEATFGGFYSERVDTELTAVLIELPRDREVGLDDLRGRFRVEGDAVDPVAVDRPVAEIFVIRDPGTRRRLVDLYRQVSDRHRRPGPKDFVARHYWTRPRPSQVGERRYLLHPHTGETDLHRHDLNRALLVDSAEPSSDDGARLIAGAAAVAGMASLDRDRRRAVVVILDEPGADDTSIPVAEIRRYLDAVGVPLVVWSPRPRAWRDGEHGWGEVRPIDVAWSYLRALDDLVDGLERQRVVWFSGRFLPQEIEVEPGAPFRRVGGTAGAARVEGARAP